MRPTGFPLPLSTFPAETITNRRFEGMPLSIPDAFYLPAGLTGLVDDPPIGTREFIEDDNRGAIDPEPIATLDAQPFFLSVKGVGSTVDPFSSQPLDPERAAALTRVAGVRDRLRPGTPGPLGGVITGELWLRGSPYGGQGLEHARTALAVSERANLTDLAGFRIAPVVKIALFPSSLEERLRSIHWFRRYTGRYVQELRLVPSNVRVYFHSKSTIGTGVSHVFERFGIASNARAHDFEVRFVRSAIPLLTLFARTLAPAGRGGRFSGLDFHDVWLDKDAVVAPDGTVYFVDLEGIEPAAVEPEEVREKIEDQIYRSLYEFMFAYEQIERERARRFGEVGSRVRQFEGIVTTALAEDPFVRLESDATGASLKIRNALEDERFYCSFRFLDF